MIFVYTCPSGSLIKERMLHATSRRNAISIAEQEGLQILKKVGGAVAIVIVKMLTNSRLRPSALTKSPKSVCKRKLIRHETRALPEDSPDLVVPVGKLRYR